MSRNFSAVLSLVGLAAAAVAAAATIVLPRAAHAAGDITIDPVAFVGTATRAQVRAQLSERPLLRGDVDWVQATPSADAQNVVRPADLRAEYKANRGEVSAMTGEDSGAAYLKRHPLPASSTSVMGAGPQTEAMPDEAAPVPESPTR